MRNRACRDNELAGVASCNRKLLESQQCLLTKSVLSVRMQMRTMQVLAGLRDPMFHWGLEFSVISNSFQQKAQQWHFLTGHLSQGARPRADQGNSEVFRFEQMNPRVANLGTWILPKLQCPLCEKGFHPPRLTADQAAQRALSFSQTGASPSA